MDNKEQKINNIAILNKATDFTNSELVSHLNGRWKGKKSGKPFTLADIQQYLIRGKLPKEYGGYPISQIEIPEIGIKVIRVKF